MSYCCSRDSVADRPRTSREGVVFCLRFLASTSASLLSVCLHSNELVIRSSWICRCAPHHRRLFSPPFGLGYFFLWKINIVNLRLGSASLWDLTFSAFTVAFGRRFVMTQFEFLFSQHTGLALCCGFFKLGIVPLRLVSHLRIFFAQFSTVQIFAMLAYFQTMRYYFWRGEGTHHASKDFSSQIAAFFSNTVEFFRIGSNQF